MKRVLLAVMALALVFTVVQIDFALAQDTEMLGAAKMAGEKPGVVMVQSVSEKVNVESVDAAARTLTLKFPDGRMVAHKVDPSVKNFDQIKAGDEIKVTYAKSVALYVRKATDSPAQGEVRTVQVAPKGAKPGVVMTGTSEITARVEAIDYANRTVTLKGPEGNVATFSVDERAKRFKAVKVGDDIVLRVTDAMVIAVETPAQ
ncbi:MAG TPA: hypothetical protein VGJ94_19030 [Syntrophorhabdaceae bacterium]|jgi:hypothetical protein